MWEASLLSKWPYVRVDGATITVAGPRALESRRRWEPVNVCTTATHVSIFGIPVLTTNVRVPRFHINSRPAEYSHTFVLYVSGMKFGPDIPSIIGLSGTVLPIGSRACC